MHWCSGQLKEETSGSVPVLGSVFSLRSAKVAHVCWGFLPWHRPLGTVLLHHPGPNEVLTGPVKAILNLGDGLRASVCPRTVLWAWCTVVLQPVQHDASSRDQRSSGLQERFVCCGRPFRGLRALQSGNIQASRQTLFPIITQLVKSTDSLSQ